MVETKDAVKLLARREVIRVMGGGMLLLVGGDVIAGCGSGNSTAAIVPPGNGALQYNITWPSRAVAKKGRLVPVATQSIQVSVMQGGQPAVSPQISTPPGSGNTTSLTFEPIPVGQVTVTATAYSTVDGTGTALATQTGTANINSGQTTNYSLDMASTVAAVGIAPAQPSLSPGATTVVAAIATDSNGNTVMIAPSVWSWSSSNTAIATVKGSGTDNTASITAVSVGTATITASYTKTNPPITGTTVATIAAAGSGGASNGGLQALSPWPMRGNNVEHTGRGLGSGAQGTYLWKFPTGGIIDSSAAIALDGTIYFGSRDGYLYALTPNGAKKWSYKTSNQVSSSPAIAADGTIYVGSIDGSLYAINPDGTKKWAYPTGQGVYSSPVIAPDGTIYVGSRDYNLYAINPNGTKKWAYKTAGTVDSSPAVAPDGTIYVGSNDSKVYAINPNGTDKWVLPTGNFVRSSPAIGADGTVYIGSNDQKLYAFTPNGTVAWTFGGTQYNQLGTIESSPAIGPDGTIYIQSSNTLFAVDAGGAGLWEVGSEPSNFASPAVTGDGTVIASMGFNFNSVLVNGISPVDGSLVFQAFGGHLNTTVYASPAIAANGTIYIGSDDNNFYAFA